MTMQFNDCTYFFPVIGILILSKSSLSENTATTSVDRREDGDIFYGQMVNNQTCTDRWAHLIINDGTVTCYCPNGILFAVAKDEIPSCYYEVDSMEGGFSGEESDNYYQYKCVTNALLSLSSADVSLITHLVVV